MVEEELPDCLRHEIHIGLHASDRCGQLRRLARELGLVARVHLNVDTGMGRLGVPPARAMYLLSEVHASPHLELAGVITHVSSPDGCLAPASQPLVSGTAVSAINTAIHSSSSARPARGDARCASR